MTMWQHVFDCSICQRQISEFAPEIRKGNERQIGPICNYCEGYYGERAPTSGAFMDRRIARRISAIANALCGEAACIDWRSHDRA